MCINGPSRHHAAARHQTIHSIIVSLLCVVLFTFNTCNIAHQSRKVNPLPENAGFTLPLLLLATCSHCFRQSRVFASTTVRPHPNHEPCLILATTSDNVFSVFPSPFAVIVVPSSSKVVFAFHSVFPSVWSVLACYAPIIHSAFFLSTLI